MAQLKPSRGRVNDHLAMTLDFSEKGERKLHMKECVRKTSKHFKHAQCFH